MRRFMALLASLALLLALAAPATANNDPHRFPFAFGSFDRNDCGFTIHFDTWSREYARMSADGSVLTVTGATGGTLSANGKAVTLNLSGPMELTFYPDGGFSQVSEGRSILWGPNLTAFGLPSNLVATSGPSESTANASGVITAMPRVPHVLVDICAALAP